MNNIIEEIIVSEDDLDDFLRQLRENGNEVVDVEEVRNDFETIVISSGEDNDDEWKQSSRGRWRRKKKEFKIIDREKQERLMNKIRKRGLIRAKW
jgi:hypothetical protein